jgi:glutamyl-tRNA reductase
MRRRRGRELFLVDVAVPRDIEEKVGTLDGVYLYNVDDLSSVVTGTQTNRLEGAHQAEAIIEEELLSYERREDIEQVTPTVRALYAWVHQVLRAEVERSLSARLRGLNETEQQALDCLVEAATKKLLHQSATTLKHWAVERPDELQSALELVRSLFIPEGFVEETGMLNVELISSPRGDHECESCPSSVGSGALVEEHR